MLWIQVTKTSYATFSINGLMLFCSYCGDLLIKANSEEEHAIDYI